MGRLRNLTESIHELATEHVEDEYDPAVADDDGDGGYDISTKIGMLLLKEEINKPLRKLEDYLNEMPGILEVFGVASQHEITTKNEEQRKQIQSLSAENLVSEYEAVVIYRYKERQLVQQPRDFRSIGKYSKPRSYAKSTTGGRSQTYIQPRAS